ncbi:PREDICTED: uncharacterized protein LOC104608622 [Nelumbo nucifera]|uniref:Uncharacterized protein LOC104608622 n=1 Tax=Nelumbo nucifera TaxID=4432 RepID=A0A1U8BA44_NELNU|nr:PREDICTED: uncharacterized protein LOC104608622 [Nelumbo nucifera]
MTNIFAETERSSQKLSKQRSFSTNLFSPKLSVYLLAVCVILFTLFQMQALKTPFSPPSPSLSFLEKWEKVVHTSLSLNCSQELRSMIAKLRDSVTFLPLKDLRYSETAMQGHTWFMSSLYDTQEEGEVQYQYFPSEASKGRLLCILGRDKHDGARNSYALAWPEALPENATLFKGLTFVSYNHYDYDNIWHGLSAMMPFVGWHRRMGCVVPTRWVLYHWGELRSNISPWLSNLMEATFGEPLNIELFDGVDGPACFEEAAVMRHNEGGMSRQRRLEVYDLLRCKARMFCNVSLEGRSSDVDEKGAPIIGMTLFMRTGARSFRNESVVIDIFKRECLKVEGCRLRVAYSNNLSFCDQVRLMGSTDILVSPHGAQLTNMFLMDTNSSVMEFFPKGWLKLAGVGQYVYQWIASWAGMRHEGAWRDPNGDACPYPEDDRRCFNIYKGGQIGYNDTYFSKWASDVLKQVKLSKVELQQVSKDATMKEQLKSSGCSCN